MMLLSKDGGVKDVVRAVCDIVSEKDQELNRVQALYHELLYAVAREFPDEDRHATALRYIHAAEQRCGCGSDVSKTEKDLQVQ